MVDKQEKKLRITAKQYKEEIENLLEDYVEVKKKAIELGYKDEVFKFKDYMNDYINLNTEK